MSDSTALRTAGRGLVLPLGLLLLWEVASHSGLVNRQFLPPLEHVGVSFWEELKSGELVEALAASLRRDLLGFALGSGIGVLVGLLLGLSRIADRIFTTWFNGLKQIALLAWIPLISLWFGFDEIAKIVFIALAASIPVILNLVEGVRATSSKLVEVGEVFRFDRLQFIVYVYLPAALPSLLTGLHLALIYAWLATIGAEYFMAAGPGIGGLIIAGRERFDMDLVMLGILVVGSIGFLIDRGASWLERRLIPWRTS
ncbi:ABC transporter permease [Bradyrhizobium sp. CIAT3101]|uniref:ABC transporter permease n=1 Tax=Bradyrhizobium sp. CIAT3101 TaxID=439387 RepID=UPI0024B0AFC7|nr:ABC transporter permease [Bradyrhizobium sp. CIAT3101]WFU78161.1 ABC transporter permease [Bradyrhizobium sp. CIAT3101]